MTDVLFISPSNDKIYQDLSNKYSAIEPPTWALLLAESCRSVGFSVKIMDMNAEKLSYTSALDRINSLNPKILCFVVYGQNVNAGTVNMSGATEFSKFLKSSDVKIPIVFLGSYMQALPFKTLEDEPSVDIVIPNEGIYTLRNLLKVSGFNEKTLENVNGIGFRKNGKAYLTKPEKIVPQEKMDIDMPGYAWDLLPYKNTPFDLYRSPMWHANYDEDKRTPYATLFTSLGCKFGCEFCMINTINRTDNDPVGVASNYKKMRFWSKDFVINQFKKLMSMGVYTIRVCDEMFMLNQNHYVPICEELANINKENKLLLWAYSRIDTVSKDDSTLDLLRNAGFNWLCLGIESGNRNIRLEVSKGKFQDVDIKDVVNKIHKSGIEVLGNYLFGLPNDDMESMKQTFELSLDLCTLGWNAYAVMALPGSKLYKDMLDSNKDELPTDYLEYSFHSFTTKPMKTSNLKPGEILKYRDECFVNYHTNPVFLQKIKEKFGEDAYNNILNMTKIKLKRKLYEDSKISV
jgi:anaerobic magnesium-protoporphyrin IX monomethyl ester cyclase